MRDIVPMLGTQASHHDSFRFHCEQVIKTLLHRLDHVRQEKEQLEKVIQDKNDRRHYEAKVTNRPTSLNKEETKVA
jgi:vacuolar-type H+-ATPase subunit I/STV1